jgi:hypothetical protein
VSLCQYGWRLLFSLIIIPAGLVFFGSMFAAYAIAILPYLLWKLILGLRPANGPADGLLDFVRYPTLKVRGFRIYPIHVLVAGAGFVLLRWVAPWLYRNTVAYYSQIHVSGREAWLALGVSVAITAALACVITYIYYDTGQVVRAFIKAKKDKLCPILDFSDPPESTN